MFSGRRIARSPLRFRSRRRIFGRERVIFIRQLSFGNGCAGFRSSRCRKVGKKFAPYSLFVADVCAEAAHLGVLVKQRASITEWSELLREKTAVALIAHMASSNPEEAEIEFADSVYSIPQMIESIPIDFAGVLDLTVCGSL